MTPRILRQKGQEIIPCRLRLRRHVPPRQRVVACGKNGIHEPRVRLKEFQLVIDERQHARGVEERECRRLHFVSVIERMEYVSSLRPWWIP